MTKGKPTKKNISDAEIRKFIEAAKTLSDEYGSVETEG